MSISDLVDLILKDNSYDYKQTREDIDNLYLEAKLCPYRFIAEFEEKALCNGYCPRCGEELKVYSYEEDRGECCGVNVTETMYDYYCSNCDYGGDE